MKARNVQDFKEENYKISFRNLKVLNTKKDFMFVGENIQPD